MCLDLRSEGPDSRVKYVLHACNLDCKPRIFTSLSLSLPFSFFLWRSVTYWSYKYNYCFLLLYYFLLLECWIWISRLSHFTGLAIPCLPFLGVYNWIFCDMLILGFNLLVWSHWTDLPLLAFVSLYPHELWSLSVKFVMFLSISILVRQNKCIALIW